MPFSEYHFLPLTFLVIKDENKNKNDRILSPKESMQVRKTGNENEKNRKQTKVSLSCLSGRGEEITDILNC